MTEGVIREIGRIFRTYCHAKHSTWPDYVKSSEKWLNEKTQQQKKRKDKHDFKINPVTYNVGELILVASHHLSSGLRGEIK